MRSILLRALLCVLIPLTALADGIRSYSSRDTSLRYMNQNPAFRSELPAVSLEVRPASSLSLEKFPQFANVYFITDTGRSSVEFDYAGLCGNLGYGVPAASCGDGLAGNSCPYTMEFVDVCLTPEEWCLGKGYTQTKSDCQIPQYPTDACPKSESLFQSCREDTARACGDAGYTLTCERGMIPDASSSCPYDGNYKTCVCNPCEGYNYSLSEANAQGYMAGPSCNSCGTVKYMRLPADCGDYVECDCGGIGTACWSGTKKLFGSCQSCCENRCTIANEDRQEGILYEHEACSDKYCDVGCAMNYEDLDNYWCEGALKCLVP